MTKSELEAYIQKRIQEKGNDAGLPKNRINNLYYFAMEDSISIILEILSKHGGLTIFSDE